MRHAAVHIAESSISAIVRKGVSIEDMILRKRCMSRRSRERRAPTASYERDDTRDLSTAKLAPPRTAARAT
jgi:hypothetical protein